jgi:site-specific DNA recombinase
VSAPPAARRPRPNPARRPSARYLLAGLLVFGACGRRLELAWSNGNPAYRCRHGYTTAGAPGPERTKNAYFRESLIVPHLAALHLLLTEPEGGPRRRRTRRGADVHSQSAEEVLCYLREQEIILTYDPAAGTLRAGSGDAAQAITLQAS